VQSAWAAARAKDCVLAAAFRRTAQRRGMKKAVVATAHRILRIAWSIIRNGTEYCERGGDHFDTLHPERTATKPLRRLERIGLEVQIRRGRGRPPLNQPKPSPPDRVPRELCQRCWKAGVRGRCICLIRKSKREPHDPLLLNNSQHRDLLFSKEWPMAVAATGDENRVRGSLICECRERNEADIGLVL
jgi:hypothetical protein